MVFDLFGTLTGAEIDRDRHIVMLADALVLPPNDLRRVLRDTFDGRAKGQFGDVRDTLATLCQMLRIAPDTAALDDAVEVRMESERQMLQPRDGAMEVLDEMRNLGVKVGVLTDCTPEIVDIWPDLPYAKSVDCVIRSCDTGWRKPDRRMYSAVLQGIGLGASVCLYIGDGGSSELTGAAAVGLRPVLLRVPGEVYHRYDPESDWAGETIEHLERVIDLLERGGFSRS